MTRTMTRRSRRALRSISAASSGRAARTQARADQTDMDSNPLPPWLGRVLRLRARSASPWVFGGRATEAGARQPRAASAEAPWLPAPVGGAGALPVAA